MTIVAASHSDATVGIGAGVTGPDGMIAGMVVAVMTGGMIVGVLTRVMTAVMTVAITAVMTGVTVTAGMIAGMAVPGSVVMIGVAVTRMIAVADAPVGAIRASARIRSRTPRRTSLRILMSQ